MRDRLEDYTTYTMRVTVGDGKVVHLATTGENRARTTVCNRPRAFWQWYPACANMPLCKVCERVVEAAKRRSH